MTQEQAGTSAATHACGGRFGNDGVHANTCMCECRACWQRALAPALGKCVCPQCRNPHHDHSAREATSVA